MNKHLSMEAISLFLKTDGTKKLRLDNLQNLGTPFFRLLNPHKWTALKYFTVNQLQLTDSVLIGCLNGMHSLEQFEARGNQKLTEKTLVKLSNSCPNLKHLNLNFTSVNAAGLSQILKKLTNLNTLKLGQVEIGGETCWKSLFAGEKELNTKKRKSDVGSSVENSKKKIKKETTTENKSTSSEDIKGYNFLKFTNLKFRETQFGSSSLEYIFKSSSETLETLDLMSTNVSNLNPFFNTSLPKLKKLNLSSTNIKSSIQLETLLKKLFAESLELKILILGCIKVLNDHCINKFSENILGLEKFSIYGNPQLKDLTTFFREMFNSNNLTRLVELNFSNCQNINFAYCEEEFYNKIGRVEPEEEDKNKIYNLKHLDLSGNVKVVDEVLENLIVKYFFNLKRLDISSSRITDVGLKNALLGLKKLSWINIEGYL
ncbi:hypothetical protein HK099_008193 [Clydaea vesicula]|uniref:Uncharacterized protein n=1 Tax=Clydaea vesicula TaxID=447962 RepID=A0AAD5TW09_9FUNG|nr:hypothetical protein HK099_008193 [Clydaea vesicula]